MSYAVPDSRTSDAVPDSRTSDAAPDSRTCDAVPDSIVIVITVVVIIVIVLCANPRQILCKSYANPTPVLCKSYANPTLSLRQSCANPAQVLGKSYATPMQRLSAHILRCACDYCACASAQHRALCARTHAQVHMAAAEWAKPSRIRRGNDASHAPRRVKSRVIATFYA